MLISLPKLRKAVNAVLHDGEERGFEEAADRYEEIDLDDPDTLLSLARAKGLTLSDYQAGEGETDVFDSSYDTDSDLDDLDNAEDDLSGDYY